VSGEAEEFWEGHYSGPERVWSGRPNPVLVDVAASLPPGTALDLGCGEGGDAVWLALRGWRVTAVDVSATALARAAEAAAAAGVSDRVDLQRHDLAASFPAGTFDLVSAQYLHSPIAFPRERVLRAAAGAVAPGGLLLVVGHGSDRPWGWNQHRDHHPDFPGPEQVLAALALPAGRWRPERLASPPRAATGPDGRTATVTDTVVAVRYLPS
jgi:SAM-dependent methyltransferase